MSLFQSYQLERDIVAIDAWEEGPPARIASGGYALSSDPERGLVTIAFIGFWDADIMRDFARDLLSEVRKVDDGSNGHIILCDLSRAVIQSQATFDSISKLLSLGPTRARRLALTTGNLAMRMQAKRLTKVLDTIAVFATNAEAMTWLTEEHAQ